LFVESNVDIWTQEIIMASIDHSKASSNAILPPVAMPPEQKLAHILAERPKFHRGELEISRNYDPDESFLPRSVAHSIANTSLVHYGIGEEATRYFFDTVSSHSKTLEIGLGISTLAFSLKRAQHVCVTPMQSEIDEINVYGSALAIDMTNTTFVCESSDTYLPKCGLSQLDLVLIDGKHAFPFPMLDWYFTADRLARGGLMVIDDVQIKPVRIVKDFMDSDPRWELVTSFDHKTFVYRKLTDVVHDVAWHMQPYSFAGMNVHRLTKAKGRVLGLLKRKVAGQG
jgi:hypothetical protein